ncbi:MAG: hypothetical protein ACT4OZ_14345 [Gemmatimonadota bacterium]
MAIDAKTIMTEHGKARRNRQRDLNSFHDILHRKNARTIVGGLLVVNNAGRFLTPLPRRREGVTEHRNIDRLVSEVIALMDALPRGRPEPGNPGLDALGVIVVTHSNVVHDETRLVVGPPSPAISDPLSYDSFLRDLCDAFSVRFAT